MLGGKSRGDKMEWWKLRDGESKESEVGKVGGERWRE